MCIKKLETVHRFCTYFLVRCCQIVTALPLYSLFHVQ